ncbi:MAG: SDR family oxidoreductase [Gammaproteobacteria bacterium]|nr:SDR family oxidoreductase [Gammaproteobacteria bacterium]
MLLQDKVIVISGVGPGLGQALARLAAEEGAKVALGARNGAYLEEVAGQVREAGGEAVWRATDVTQGDQCQALVSAAVEAFGGLDGLVNSAYNHGGWATCDAASPDDWGAAYDVNCLGALRMAQAALPAMREAGGGAIVNVSTMTTVNPFPGEAAYAASKGALNAMTRHMAQDFGPFNIRVNAVRLGWIHGAPVRGFIDAQVADGRLREDVVGEIAGRIPLGLIPPEDDCARAVLFFVSNYSKVVTGASLDANGGQYMAP